MKIRLGTRDADDILARFWQKGVDRDELCKYTNSPSGVDFIVKKVKPKHTESQRGYYWQSLKWWGEQMGYSARESEYWIHNAVCCEAFGIKGTKRFYGIQIEIPNQTSAKANREDYSKLIDTMLRLASEDGVVIPEPIDDA